MPLKLQFSTDMILMKRLISNDSAQRDESYRELSIRLNDLQNKWMRNCSYVEDINEVICLEQFYGVEQLESESTTYHNRFKQTSVCSMWIELC